MSKKSIIVLVVIFLLIFFGALAAGFWFMSAKFSDMTGKIDEKKEEVVVEEERTAPEIGTMVHLKTFIVNLADPGGKRYLRVTMSLEVESEDVENQIKDRLPQVRHQILMILPTKKVSDIQSVQGKTLLMEEVKSALNGLLEPGRVLNIYFTEFVVQ